jgi:hypothetical protein
MAPSRFDEHIPFSGHYDLAICFNLVNNILDDESTIVGITFLSCLLAL